MRITHERVLALSQEIADWLRGVAMDGNKDLTPAERRELIEIALEVERHPRGRARTRSTPQSVEPRGIGERAALTYRAWLTMVDGPLPAIGDEVVDARGSRSMSDSPGLPPRWGRDTLQEGRHDEVRSLNRG